MSETDPARRKLPRRPSAFRPFEGARTDLFGYFVEQLGEVRFDSLFTEELIQELFPQATIRPPAAGQRQHCCVIERPAGP